MKREVRAGCTHMFFMASIWWQFKTWEGVRIENYTNHSEIRSEIDRKDHVLVGGETSPSSFLLFKS